MSALPRTADGFNTPFDRQADSFDRRAGLPPGVAEAVASAMSRLLPPADPDPGLLLEMGTGTGEIGAALAVRVPRYLGFDLSLPMLLRARRRLAQGVAAQGDGDGTWPVPDGKVSLIFLSRAAHLLDLDHLVAEALRVARPGGALFILGRVRREPGSVRATLRREMRRLLGEHGIQGRSAEEAHRRLAAAFEAEGGEALPSRLVASWRVLERPADSLSSWRGKPGLRGVAVPARVQQEVLDRLETWARERYGDLAVPREATEDYELTVIRLPKRQQEGGG